MTIVEMEKEHPVAYGYLKEFVRKYFAGESAFGVAIADAFYAGWCAAVKEASSMFGKENT